MGNTTYSGPVRSEGGFEQITKTAATGAITTNLDIDSSGNISGTGTEITGFVVPTVTILAAYTSGTVLTASQSGSIVTFPAMDGAATLSLPAAATCVGSTFHFVMLGTAGNDVDIITNGSEKIIGCVPKGDGDNVGIADAVSTVPEVYPVTIVTIGTTKPVIDVPVPEMLPLESISKLVVIAPVDEFLVICSKPPSALIGPLNVELAIYCLRFPSA